MAGPNEILSTKWPSMMSQWIQSAPAASTLRISSARFEKLAARMDGATMTFGIQTNVQRSTLNVQRSIQVRAGLAHICIRPHWGLRGWRLGVFCLLYIY